MTERNASPGDFVHAATDGNARPLLTIVRADKVRITVKVPDRDVPRLDRGDPATIRIDSLPDHVYHGKVARTAFAIDPEDRTLRTEIDLDNADGRLRPGQYGSVAITLQSRPDVLTVPASAFVVRDRDAGGVVFRVVDGHAVRTRVKRGQDNGRRVEITEGLKEGETVIVSPEVKKIMDGQEVEPAKDEEG